VAGKGAFFGKKGGKYSGGVLRKKKSPTHMGEARERAPRLLLQERGSHLNQKRWFLRKRIQKPVCKSLYLKPPPQKAPMSRKSILAERERQGDLRRTPKTILTQTGVARKREALEAKNRKRIGKSDLREECETPHGWRWYKRPRRGDNVCFRSKGNSGRDQKKTKHLVSFW